MSGTVTGKAAGQSLLKNPTKAKKGFQLNTHVHGETYSEDDLKILREMEDEDFLALGTDYRHTGKNYKSVQAIHQLAEEQVTRYMADELARQAETTNLPVLAFAVTQVANRCHVTQVGW